MDNLRRYSFDVASKTVSISPGFSPENLIEVVGNLENYRGLSIVKYGNKQNLIGNVITIKSQSIKCRVAIGGDNCSLFIDGNVSGQVDVTLWRAGKVSIGRFTTINEARIIADNSDVIISSDCLLSDGILFQSNDQHGLFDLSAGVMLNSGRRRLLIEDHVWVGRRVVLMPDIIVGKGAVLSTCAVVTKNVPPFTYAAGIPARVVRETASWFRNPSDPSEKELTFFLDNGFEGVLSKIRK